MSAGTPRPVAPAARRGVFDSLPGWLAPREQGSGESSGRRWLIETVVLVVVGVFLVVAVPTTSPVRAASTRA